MPDGLLMAGEYDPVILGGNNYIYSPGQFPPSSMWDRVRHAFTAHYIGFNAPSVDSTWLGTGEIVPNANDCITTPNVDRWQRGRITDGANYWFGSYDQRTRELTRLVDAGPHSGTESSSAGLFWATPWLLNASHVLISQSGHGNFGGAGSARLWKWDGVALSTALEGTRPGRWGVDCDGLGSSAAGIVHCHHAFGGYDGTYWSAELMALWADGGSNYNMLAWGLCGLTEVSSSVPATGFTIGAVRGGGPDPWTNGPEHYFDGNNCLGVAVYQDDLSLYRDVDTITATQPVLWQGQAQICTNKATDPYYHDPVSGTRIPIPYVPSNDYTFLYSVTTGGMAPALALELVGTDTWAGCGMMCFHASDLCLYVCYVATQAGSPRFNNVYHGRIRLFKFSTPTIYTEMPDFTFNFGGPPYPQLTIEPGIMTSNENEIIITCVRQQNLTGTSVGFSYKAQVFNTVTHTWSEANTYRGKSMTGIDGMYLTPYRKDVGRV